MVVVVLPFVVDFLLGNELGIAVEFRVGEMARGRAGVVEDVEEELAVVLAHARAAPDDLLELGHRADDADEHDVLDHRRVDAGGEKLRGGEDDGCVGFEFLEAAEMALADAAFVGGDAADVVGVCLRRGRRSDC